MNTSFEQIYNCFYSKITDDMYMELDENQTKAMSEELLLNALPWFEFPRVNIHNYDLEKKLFNATLSYEEVNIIATYMMIGWIDQQLASVEVTRMKYTGSDFKMSSQANHMSKLNTIRKEYERVGLHLQRLYKRRKADKNGIMKSTMRGLMPMSARFGNMMTSPVSSTDCRCDNSWGDFSDVTDDDPIPPPNNVPSTGGSSGSSTGGSSSDDSWEDMEDFPTSDKPNNGSGDSWTGL